MRARFGVVVVAALAVPLLSVNPALARDASAAEVQDLAARAAFSEQARSSLAEVTSIDGAPVDMEAILDGADWQVAERLETLQNLVGRSSGGPWNADSVRDEASRILSDPRFGGLEGTRSSSWWQSFTEWLADLVPDPIAAALASTGFWMVVGLAVIVLVAASVLRLAGRRQKALNQAAVDESPTPGIDLRSLDAAADQAEKAGDFSDAVRLRFRAGMMRLAGKGVVQHEQSATAGMLRRLVRHPVVLDVAGTFEAVAYAGRSASELEAVAARDGWRQILASVGSTDG